MMEETFTEFSRRIRKACGKHNFKVKNSFGVKDCYNRVRKNKWSDIGMRLTDSQFLAIIREVNMRLADNIVNGITVKFPSGMGKLEARRIEKRPRVTKDGKLKVVNPVDWQSTLRLWYEDEEARKQKQLIRYSGKVGYWIKYSNVLAYYNNRSFYEFAIQRPINHRFNENVKEGKIKVLW